MIRDRGTVAGELFAAGHLCSQAVLATLAGEFGVDEATALRVACGLGSGIARRQHVCGAVTGAIMAAGLKYGRVDPADRDALDRTYAAAQQIMDRFSEGHGSIICRELLGCDISTPEARLEAEQQGLFATRCRAFVEDAVRIAEEVCGLRERN